MVLEKFKNVFTKHCLFEASGSQSVFMGESFQD